MSTPPLPDGTYDAIVVDADTRDDGTTALELTVLAGPGCASNPEGRHAPRRSLRAAAASISGPR